MWKSLMQLWKADNLLQQAWSESFEMLEIDREMFLEAVRILRESEDLEMSREVRQKDKLVNRYEREVRRKVMAHTAISGNADLAGAMVLISLVIDIERIGDYCKSIVDLAAAHPQRLNVPALEERLCEIESEIKQNFEQTIVAVQRQDEDLARRLMDAFRHEISRNCEQIVVDVVSGGQEGIDAADAATLAIYARYLKSISVHLYNLLTGVTNPFHRIGFKEKRKGTKTDPNTNSSSPRA
jgi:phosphate transport system protein